MAAPVVKWICRELSKLLNFQANEEIARYILAIETRDELEEYLGDLLDKRDPRAKKFIEELLKKWRAPERVVRAPDDLQAYRKQDEDLTYVSATNKSKKKGKKGGGNTPRAEDSPPRTSEETNHASASGDVGGVGGSSQKGKAKFVPLFGEGGQLKAGAKLPGRHPCECQATKHKLISNCLGCGRVVCEQEGSGPCLFCGVLVCTAEELEVLNRGSKKSEKLREQLTSRGQGGMLGGGDKGLPHLSAKVQEGLEKAMKHRDKLIHFDRTSQRRTQVIDDESDYFTTDNKWLSDEEKKALKKREDELRAQRHGSRLDRKITLDFAGRQVLESQSDVDVYNPADAVIQAVHYGKGRLDGRNNADEGATLKDEDFTDLVNPHIVQHAPQFVPSEEGRPSAWKKEAKENGDLSSDTRRALRIQDSELKEMSDDGMCMSMHQPWATLLIQGIKIHEGRSWYTTHRGRLYIAATAKAPSAQEVAAVEQQYRIHYNDATIDFPNDYPVGCLLGSVDVVDCMSQEDYIEKFPDGESGSPYVFICQNPQELLVKFPIKGKHKIYKLDGHVHQAAKKGLRESKPPSKIRK